MSLDQPEGFVKHQTLTRDAFLGGRIEVSQPRHGFRAGFDSVLLGAAVGHGRRSILDLGAGAGVASLVALAHEEGRTACLIERDPDMLTLAKANLEANGFAGRASVIELDVAAKGSVRAAMGLKSDFFDAVIANPPFFVKERGTAPRDFSRAGARHMEKGELQLWIRTAAASAAPGGEVIFIHHVQALPDLLGGLAARFGAITVLPLCPRPGADATRLLVRGIKGSGAPLSLRAPLALHGAEGSEHSPALSTILRGEGRLDW